MVPPTGGIMSLPTFLIIFAIVIVLLIILALYAICKAGGDADDLSEVIIAELKKAKNESHP
jgi:uncharacterized membrane protein